ncbi:MAG: glycosyltransferase [Negativicutes bacterium]
MKILSFCKYGFSRAKSWYARRRRFPTYREIGGLIRRAWFEWRSISAQPLSADSSRFKIPPELEPYEAWKKQNVWTTRRREVLEIQLKNLVSKPLFSVIMPVYNPPVKFLNLAIESVVNQVYSNWELCIVDDASTNPEIRETLEKWSKIDDRIRVYFSQQNGNISRATNQAVEIATGEYIALLDNDDELTPDALGEVALYLSQHPDTEVLYSDDDKIDVEGRRFDPQFKPDWSPELLLNYMYFSHLFVMKKKIYQDAGGMRVGFEGSQDYDLALRVTEIAREVGHIPKILYHWRVLPGSTASSGNSKPESFVNGLLAVKEACSRRKIQAEVIQPEWAVQSGCGIFSLVFPNNGPSVSIIIPNKNNYRVLKKCLESLKKTTYKNYEVIVIDNQSDDRETLEYLNTIPYKVLKFENPNGKFSFSALNNWAVRQVNSKYVLFLNNDTEVISPDWLSQMVGYLGIEGVGAVGAKLSFPDERIQHAGIIHGLYGGMAGPAFRLLPSWHGGYLSYLNVARNYLAVTAACMLTDRKLFLSIGGFDESDFAVAYNDVDYCYRLHEKGYRIVYCPTAHLYHYEGFSRGYCDNPKEVAKFKTKYWNKYDPYYNPNLSLDNERFEIAASTMISPYFKPKPRVLMVAFNLNWEGAPYSQYEMTLALKKKGVIEPIVYCPTDGPLRQEYEKNNIPVHVFPHPLSDIYTLEKYNSAIDKFCAKIREWNIEVIYGNTLQTFYVIDAANRLGLPSIWNPRESEPWQSYFDHFGPDIAAKAIQCFQYPYKIIFVADATRNGCLPLNSQRNFTTVHNGLDLTRLKKEALTWPRAVARQKLGITDNEVVVLLLGTVCERKGQLDLVKAMGLLSKNLITRVRSIIVGNRPSEYSKKLEQYRMALPEEYARQIIIEDETADTALFYSAADIFVCSSRIESYPRVILEAMAYSLPIITTPVFGIREQVRENINAFFYEPGDIEELSRHLEKLIIQDNLRRDMAANSSDVLQTLNNFEIMTEAYGRIFQEAWFTGGRV